MFCHTASRLHCTLQGIAKVIRSNQGKELGISDSAEEWRDPDLAAFDHLTHCDAHFIAWVIYLPGRQAEEPVFFRKLPHPHTGISPLVLSDHPGTHHRWLTNWNPTWDFRRPEAIAKWTRRELAAGTYSEAFTAVAQESIMKTGTLPPIPSF